MKFEFKNSNYSAFWADQKALKTYVDTTPFLRTNFGFWKSQFDIDPELTPSSTRGDASFTIKSYIRKPSPLMDMVAPMGKGKALDREGLSAYSASIPHFIAPNFQETAMERLEKERMFDIYGDDTDLVIQWTRTVQEMVDSTDQTLSNMSAQLLSTGEIDWKYGRGIKNFLYTANLPKENIIQAGTETWNSPSCKLLDQMAKIEKDFRFRLGLADSFPLKWQIPYDMFYNVFLTNAQVRQFIVDYRTNNQMATTEGFVLNEEMFRKVISAYYKQISPIEIIEEKQSDVYQGSVSGWKSGIAVLRPSGYAGVIKHTTHLEQFLFEKYGSKSISKVFSKVNNPLFTLINTSQDNGELQEWHTDLIMSAIPALDEVPYHLLVKTTESGSGTTTIGE